MKRFFKDLWYYHETGCKFAIYLGIGYLISCTMALTHFAISKPSDILPMTFFVTVFWPVIPVVALPYLLYGS